MPIDKNKTPAALALEFIDDTQWRTRHNLDPKYGQLLNDIKADYNNGNAPLAQQRAQESLNILGARIKNYNNWDDLTPGNFSALKPALDSIKIRNTAAQAQEKQFRDGLDLATVLANKNVGDEFIADEKTIKLTDNMIKAADDLVKDATGNQVGIFYYDPKNAASRRLRSIGQQDSVENQRKALLRFITEKTDQADQKEKIFEKRQTAVEYFIKELKKIENDETRERKFQEGAARVRMDLEKMDLHNIPENQKSNVDNIVEIYAQKTNDPEENHEKVFRNLRDAVSKTAAQKKALEEKLEASENKDLAESSIKTLRRLYPANNRYNLSIRNHLKTLEDAVKRDDKDAIDALASFGKKTKGKSDAMIKRMWNQMMRNLISSGSANRQSYAPYGNNRLFGGALNNPYNQLAAMQNWGTGFGLPAGGVMAPYPLNPFLGGFQPSQFNWGQTLGLPNFHQLPGM